MNDLFERETAVLQRAKSFLGGLKDISTDYYEEFTSMTLEYECLLRQVRLMMRCSDLTALGLNTDKLNLLDKVNIDELTGIYNRRYLDENLKRYVKLLSRSRGSISVLMLDLDFFKLYNDTYGHAAGDVCLRKVAGALQDSISRNEDFAARYGGEEFVVVLFGTSGADAMVVADRILENVRRLKIPHIQNQPAGCVTISIGVTSAVTHHTHTPQAYIERADAALYQSKSAGRNRITYYEFQEDAQ